MWTTSISMNVDLRGNGMPPDQRAIVERLRKQAFAVQRQFELAEHSAIVLDEILRTGSGSVTAAIEGTYEGNTVAVLTLQLFRLLIVDLYACVLDGHARNGSIRSILKELRRDSAALDAIRAYYSDPTCLVATVEGENLTPAFIERETASAIRRSVEESIQSINSNWQKVDAKSAVLSTDEAKRICWARVKAVAHLERTAVGIVELDETPEFGTGKLTYGEPLKFLAAVRPYVYDVFHLITSTSWVGGDRLDRFYVQAFWDRFKNGHTALQLPAFAPLA